jgi:hypothetical protein
MLYAVLHLSPSTTLKKAQAGKKGHGGKGPYSWRTSIKLRRAKKHIAPKCKASSASV